MKVKLTESQYKRIILQEDEKLTPYHARAFEQMDREYGTENKFEYYYPARFKSVFDETDEISKVMAHNYIKYDDGSGDYKKFIGEPYSTPDNLAWGVDDAELQHITYRFTVNDQDLRSLPPPKSISPSTQIISLMNDNISHVDLTGYENLRDLFTLNLLGNPVRTVNIPVLIEFLNNHPHMAKFTMNYIPNEEFNEEHVEFIKDSMIEDSGVNLQITPLPDD